MSELERLKEEVLYWKDQYYLQKDRAEFIIMATRTPAEERYNIALQATCLAAAQRQEALVEVLELREEVKRLKSGKFTEVGAAVTENSLVGKPRYKHSCPNCIYLGEVGEYDTYFCKEHTVDGYPLSMVGELSVACRVGDPSVCCAYSWQQLKWKVRASLPKIDCEPYREVLKEALRMACKQGYICETVVASAFAGGSIENPRPTP